VSVEEDPESSGISLVVAVQCSRSAPSEFSKLKGLGSNPQVLLAGNRQVIDQKSSSRALVYKGGTAFGHLTVERQARCGPQSIGGPLQRGGNTADSNQCEPPLEFGPFRAFGNASNRNANCRWWL
jgi:hypothetical protein